VLGLRESFLFQELAEDLLAGLLELRLIVRHQKPIKRSLIARKVSPCVLTIEILEFGLSKYLACRFLQFTIVRPTLFDRSWRPCSNKESAAVCSDNWRRAIFDLVITIPIASGSPSLEDLVRRDALRHALDVAGIGIWTYVAYSSGKIHLYYQVADEAAAAGAITQWMQQHMAGAQYQITPRSVFDVKDETPLPPCPFCGFKQPYGRTDGRCVGCGKLLPE